jgi:hypothetical protein
LAEEQLSMLRWRILSRMSKQVPSLKTEATREGLSMLRFKQC